MTARFILSLDCEGKWGVADHLTPADHEQLATPRLRQAYGDILSLLDRLAIPATFAFVGLFAMSEAERRRRDLSSLAARSPTYLGKALEDADNGSRDGWTGDWALDLTKAANTPHEIALHGVTHVPWTDMDAAFAAEEMALLDGTDLKAARTFIHPRNAIGHLGVLKAAGIEGYRQAPVSKGRLANLLSEFDLNTPPDADPPDEPGHPTPIPAGRFVNWQSGLRRLAPPALTRARARAMLAKAARTGEVVHFWTHPENIASAPATLEVLRGILEEVADAREAGRCAVLTQEQYVDARPEGRR